MLQQLCVVAVVVVVVGLMTDVVPRVVQQHGVLHHSPVHPLRREHEPHRRVLGHEAGHRGHEVMHVRQQRLRRRLQGLRHLHAAVQLLHPLPLAAPTPTRASRLHDRVPFHAV